MNTTSRIAKIDNSAARLLSPIENFSGILEGSKTEKKKSVRRQRALREPYCGNYLVLQEIQI